MWPLQVTLITFLLALRGCHADLPLSMIDHLIEQGGEPQAILAFSCQRNDSMSILAHFAKKLQQVNVIPTNIHLRFLPITSRRITFVLNLECPNARKLLLKAWAARFFADPFKWITYSNEVLNIDKLIVKYFGELEILVDSDVTVAISNQHTFAVHKIYQRNVNTSILREWMGVWTDEQGFIDNGLQRITYKRRQNLKRTVLKATMAVLNNKSLEHLTDKRDTHIDSLSKVCYVLMQHLSDIINVELRYTLFWDWGYKDNNSKWSGMIGTLTRKEADICGTGLFLTGDRVDAVDYLPMVIPTGGHFIFRQPKLSYVANIFTLPFSGLVWACFGGLLVITGAIFYIVVKWEQKKKKYVEILMGLHASNFNEFKENNNHYSLTEVVFITFAAMCQQGASYIPYSIPGRITVIFLLVSFMFLYTSYSANILALLQSSSNSIQTLEDLLNSRLDVGVDDVAYNHYYFTTPTEPIRRALYFKKFAPLGQRPKFYPVDKGMKKMRNELFAFHVEVGPGYKIVSETFEESEKCGLQGIRYLDVFNPGFAAQKNSCFKKMFKIGFCLLRENGIRNREIDLIYTKKPPCVGSGSSFVSVGLIDCYGAIMVFVAGMGAAIVIFFTEVLIYMRMEYCIGRLSRYINPKLPSTRKNINFVN